MALLQISEPGMSAAPHQHRLAVGIDLGTTNSLVATVRSGSAVCLPDSDGRTTLPSVVRYLDGEVEVGKNALSAQKTDPLNTVSSAKRLIGRTLTDLAQEAQYLPYRFTPNERVVELNTRQGAKTPIEVSAEILKALKSRAEETLGGDLVGAVITVPAYFDDAQRQATKDAARLAGLNVLRLLNEPTAAAIAYGLDNASEGTFVVYDLGGGTFDVSVLQLTKGLFEVKATGGNSALGGDDFDHRLFCYLLEQNDLSKLNEQDSQLLLSLARTAKEKLTTQTEAVIETILSDGHKVHTVITRQEFHNLTQNLVQKTIEPVKQALKDAGVTKADVKGVIMVGGSTRMDVCLYGGAECDHFVRIEVVQWSLAKEGGNCLLNVQHAGRAANHNHAFNVGFGHACVFQCLFDRLYGFLHQILGQIVKLLAGNNSMDFIAV